MLDQLIENLETITDVDAFKTICILETATLDIIVQRALTTIWKNNKMLEVLAEHKVYVDKLKRKSLALDFEEHDILVQLYALLEEVERDCINVHTALHDQINAKQILTNVSFNTLKSFITAPIDDKNTNEWLLPIICKVIEEKTYTKREIAEHTPQITEMLSCSSEILRGVLSYEHYIIVHRTLAISKAFNVALKNIEELKVNNLQKNLDLFLAALNICLCVISKIFNAENLEKALSLHSQLPFNMQNEEEVKRHFEAMSA